MAKKKVSDYVDELKEMIVERTGKYDAWLSVQVRMTAMNMVILDKLQDELADAELTTSMTGSMGQQKIEVNPLIDKYNATMRTMTDQLEALGLNYNTAKGKVATNGGSAADNPAANDDPVLAALLNK